VSFLSSGEDDTASERAVLPQRTLTLIEPNALREIADDLP